MIRVTAASHYLYPVPEGAVLPSLEADLQEVCRENFRRTDRFIQLALLGSGRCVRGQVLEPGCGLYLGSGHGPVGNNINTQQQLIRDRLVPKPFNFINTLGNSAGYYVAKNLGLNGQNFFISRRAATFAALLEAALVDLECAALQQALVGVVEEVTLPLADHRRRQGLPPDLAVAEGSHWLLLERDTETGHRLEIRHQVQHEARPRPVPFHDSIAAAAVTERLVKGDAAVFTEGDAVRGWTSFHFSP